MEFILIKSTISLAGWQGIQNCFVVGVRNSQAICFSPEFLRAKTAWQDLLDSTEIYIGGNNISFWEKIFKKCYAHDIKVLTMSVEELILIKYFRNSFLATKVSFFNQINKKEKSEAQVRLFYSDEKQDWKIWAFPQKSNTGMTTSELPEDPEWNEQWNSVTENGLYYQWGTIHSHCNAGAFASGTDKNDEAKLFFFILSPSSFILGRNNHG